MATRFGTAGDFLDYTGGAPDTTACTVVGWIKVTGGAATDRTFFRFRNSGDSTVGTYFVGNTDNAVSIASIGGSVSSGYVPPTGAWARVAIVTSGTTGTVYAGGVEGAISSATATMSGNTPAAKYAVGGRGGGDTSETFLGPMAGLKIYNRVFSLPELLSEWGYLLPLRTSGLYAAYPLDSGTAAGRLDHSGNGRMLAAGATLTDDGPPIPRQRIVIREWLSAPASSGTTATPGVATGTGAALAPTANVVQPIGVATATGTAPAPSGRPTGGLAVASATGAALAPQANVVAPAGLAAGTGAALAPTASTTGSTTATPGVASGTGAALSPTANVVQPIGLASGTGAALALTGRPATAGMGVASGAGAALAPAVAVVQPVGVATGTGAALSPTASTANTTTAAVGLASGAGTALAPAVAIVQPVGVASGTGAALAPAMAVAANVGLASGTGAALAPSTTTSPTVTAAVGLASAIGAALAPLSRIISAVGRASGVGVALSPVAGGVAPAYPLAAGDVERVGALRAGSALVVLDDLHAGGVTRA